VVRGDELNEMGDDLPVVHLGSSPVVSLASRDDHTCAILSNGQVKCWGTNNLGQLGLGDTVRRGDQAGEMGGSLPAVNLGTGRTATALAGGNEHTCALLDNAQVKCWGENTSGKLGLGHTNHMGDGSGEMGDALSTVALGTGRTVQAVGSGNDHNCALLDNGQVKCWGQNTSGQLGLGDTVSRGDGPGELGDALGAVPLGSNAMAIAVGGAFSCALLTNGSVKCWGMNDYGQLGQGDVAARGDTAGEVAALQPINLGTSLTAIAIAAGSIHACAQLNTNEIKCWGGNQNGQLGLGHADNMGNAAGEMGNALPVVYLGSGVAVASVHGGRRHTCARLSNNTLKCWGLNASGQLGLGNTANRGDQANEMGDFLAAVSLGSGAHATNLALGFDHTCAVLNNGQTKCWGQNELGQLGLGNTLYMGNQAGEMGDALAAVDLGPEN